MKSDILESPQLQNFSKHFFFSFFLFQDDSLFGGTNAGMDDLAAEAATSKPPKAKSDKRMSVERIYQKKTQLEHILLRPDTYIGSPNPVTEKMYILDTNSNRIVQKEITYSPGLFKIFDEILVNAADNKQRDAKMDTIRVDISAEKNEVTKNLNITHARFAKK